MAYYTDLVAPRVNALEGMRAEQGPPAYLRALREVHALIPSPPEGLAYADELLGRKDDDAAIRALGVLLEISKQAPQGLFDNSALLDEYVKVASARYNELKGRLVLEQKVEGVFVIEMQGALA
ncbi:MAG TPA: hypothetical protein VIV60_15830, partial [Polyangiaceae bacterium]